jgi:gluconate 2-dehydrogenase gamma chain
MPSANTGEGPLKDASPFPGEGGGLSRRTVLKLGLVGVLGAACGAGSTRLITRFGKAARPAYRFFTEKEASLVVIAICDQIIPCDDVPGATETGAIHYIDRQLCGPLARHREAYRRGLEAFRQTCLEACKAPFESLPPDARIEALRLIEAGEAPGALWGKPSAPEFFNLVLAHTMQSFYGSPRHGGDRDYASYRMLGLDYPQIVGQSRYPKA